MNGTVEEAKKYLEKKYNPKLIILYGSFSSNTENELSDIDMACFSDVAEESHDSSKIGLFLLDAWIHPLAELKRPGKYLHFLPCQCLHDELEVFEKFTKSIEKARRKKQKPIKKNEKDILDPWIEKMIKRSTLEDEEAYYRYNWLIHDFPELYCKYLNIYYDGPKKTINYLRENDVDTFRQYSNLLKNGKDIEKMRQLYDSILRRCVI